MVSAACPSCKIVELQTPWGDGFYHSGDPQRDAVQPGPERRPPADRARPADEDQERRLEGVVGVVGLAERGAADAPDHRPVPLDQRRERLLGGRPGQEAYLARRAGAKWYVGGISALAAKTYQTPLAFLGTGSWLLETVRDNGGNLLRETRTVTSADTLTVPLVQRGGFASVLCPYTTGMTTCGTAPTGTVLRGVQSGRCVDVPGNTTTPGTAVALWDCNGGGNQQWVYVR